MTRYQEFLEQAERQDHLENCPHTDLVRGRNGKFYCPICEDPLEHCDHTLELGLDGKFYCRICEPVRGPKGETDGTESTDSNTQSE